jgi:hypothetical protein
MPEVMLKPDSQSVGVVSSMTLMVSPSSASVDSSQKHSLSFISRTIPQQALSKPSFSTVKNGEQRSRKS